MVSLASTRWKKGIVANANLLVKGLLRTCWEVKDFYNDK